MNVKCIKCNRRMVPHECIYVCLGCEHRVEIEDWVELADIAEDYSKSKVAYPDPRPIGAKLYDDI